jgi:hypothetical protein
VRSALRRIAIVGQRLVVLELAEVAAEGDLLRRGKVLPREDQHQMLVPGLEDLPSREVVERLPEVDAGDLAAEREAQLPYG